MNYSGAWQDCKAAIEYVHAKYIVTEKKKGNDIRMYAYGCSLGAQLLGLYLRKEGEKATKYLDGCGLYGTPWSIVKGEYHFYERAYGIYQRVIGTKLNEAIRHDQLPKMKKYLSEEDFNIYNATLATNWSGLSAMDDHIFPRMFGYKGRNDYY